MAKSSGHGGGMQPGASFRADTTCRGYVLGYESSYTVCKHAGGLVYVTVTVSTAHAGAEDRTYDLPMQRKTYKLPSVGQ
jgi:hypothetical protein